MFCRKQTLDSSYITVFDYFYSWIGAQHQGSSAAVFCPQSIRFEALERQKSVRTVMANSDIQTSSACKG